MGWSRRKSRLRFWLFFSSRWLFIARRRSSFPVPVTLNRFFAPLCVFCFGIVSRHSRVLRRAEQHDHVPSVEERRRLHLADLLDVLRQAHQEVPPALRMGGLAPPEHNRDLDLRALVEEALDVALLGVVVVNADLRPELDLLDVDRDLVLARELRLLLLLVAVLPVVHYPRDGRIRLGCHLDEVEVLVEGVLDRLRRGLDPELAPVLVDEPDAWGADRLVDPRLLDDRTLLVEPSSGPQRALTKLLILFLPLTTKTAARSGPVPRPIDSVEPRGALGSRGEKRGRPCLQAYRLASSERSSSRLRVACSPPRLRTARRSRDSRSPTTITYGTFSSSADRIRLLTGSSLAAASTRQPAG